MNKKYFSVVFTFLIISTLLIYLFERKSIDLPNSSCEYFMEELTNKNIVETTNNFELIDQLIELYDLNGNKIQLGDLILGNTLVFRYSVMHCSSCVYEKIQQIDSLYKKGTKNVFVIAHYDNLRNVLIDYKRNDYSVPFYILPENQFLNELDNLKVPQFFLLDNELMINQVFIPGVSKKLDELFLLGAIKFLSY